jgi:hypothetical protein
MTELNKKTIDFLNARIKSLLFESSLSLPKMANELCLSYEELDKYINKLGLSWIKEHRRKMSKGQTVLTSVLKKLIPGETIINEFHIGERLKLDVYCPSYKIAAEYHGIQHFKYTERFHEFKEDFLNGQKRDQRKLELCNEQGIVLVVFRYNDKLTEEVVYDRILSALKSSSHIVKVKDKKNITENPFYQQAKKRNSDKKKKLYRKIKEKKKNDRNRK